MYEINQNIHLINQNKLPAINKNIEFIIKDTQFLNQQQNKHDILTKVNHENIGALDKRVEALEGTIKFLGSQISSMGKTWAQNSIDIRKSNVRIDEALKGVDSVSHNMQMHLPKEMKAIENSIAILQMQLSASGKTNEAFDRFKKEIDGKVIHTLNRLDEF